jgi:hypothetical protein
MEASMASITFLPPSVARWTDLEVRFFSEVQAELMHDGLALHAVRGVTSDIPWCVLWETRTNRMVRIARTQRSYLVVWLDTGHSRRTHDIEVAMDLIRQRWRHLAGRVETLPDLGSAR